MDKPVRPAQSVLEAAAASRIGAYEILIDGRFRIPWKLYEPFGFGEGWPTYTITPMLRVLATSPQRPAPWPLIWQAWERERQTRQAWERSVQESIVRINSSPELCHLANAQQYKDVLRPRLDFVDLDPLEIGVGDKPPHHPHVGQLTIGERWEFYSLADLLIRLMTPHLRPTEFRQPDKT